MGDPNGTIGIPENEARQKDEASKGGMAAVYRDRIPREKALEVLARGGELSEADDLRCKVRDFSDGTALSARGCHRKVAGLDSRMVVQGR